MVALAAMDTKSKRPHPQQGGQWISVHYLQELSDTEALWVFWYVSVESTIQKVELKSRDAISA